MTQAEVERILAVWQERLRLGHWDIKVRWGLPIEASEQAEAEIRVHDDYEQASIRIQEGFEERWSPRFANETIVHELLHVFERGTRLAVKAMDPTETGAASGSAFWLLWSRYVHESEGWIDRLALILVDLVGLA